MGFVDFDADAKIIDIMMESQNLNVHSGAMDLDFALNGAMDAINSTKQCYDEKH